MGIGREGADDFHPWFDPGVGRIDNAEYGLAAVCSGDVPFARYLDPSLDLDLTGTIMEGKPSCTLRYHVKA